MPNRTSILGYASPLAVEPGETINFHLSSPSVSEASLEVVRIRCADADADGPGLRYTRVSASINGPVALRHQPLRPGSYLRVEDSGILAGLKGFAFTCHLWPTCCNGKRQTIAARWDAETDTGWRLQQLEDSTLMLEVADVERRASAKLSRPLAERQWIFLAASLDLQGGVLRIQTDDDIAEVSIPPIVFIWPAATPLFLAAEPSRNGSRSAHFNGKIDRPRLFRDTLPFDILKQRSLPSNPDTNDPALVAAWSFSADMVNECIPDLSRNNLHGKLFNGPARAMTGANWQGDAVLWVQAPHEYGSVHFHDDDIDDADWAPDRTLEVPTNWNSGFYALRLSAELHGEAIESFVSFFVSAAPRQPKAPVAFIASTATFLAYANQALRHDQMHMESMLEKLIVLSEDDIYLQEHPEVGLSTYDRHSDGSGACYSSSNRPILNMRPAGAAFNYGNDSLITDWLEERGIAYDVISDEHIHRHGASLLAPYRCVITGSHPEYFSREMLNAFEHYQAHGGRHMYLGGNGFYWRSTWHPDKPGRLEVRRGVTGVRTWEGEAGENGLSYSGEPGGLWRSNGRAPQKLVGVGFCAQVYTHGSPYRALPDALSSEASWVFEGVNLDQPIGDFGLRGGGAAGIEVDRVEPTLGSPRNLLHLATADNLGTGGLLSMEEFACTHHGLSGDQSAQVRADLVLFSVPGGGQVFSTGSISWSCSLPHNGYDNNVARITGNVLDRFLQP